MVLFIQQKEKNRDFYVKSAVIFGEKIKMYYHNKYYCECSLCSVERIRGRILLTFPFLYFPDFLWNFLNVFSVKLEFKVISYE